MTEKPISVRPATTDDKQKIYDLLMFLYAENAPFKMNESKVREMIRRGADDKDVIIAVVDAPDGTIAGSVGACFEQWWHTDDWHIGEMWNFVHPNHRHSTHAKDLITYMKWVAEQMNMSLHMGIITGTKMEAKIRLYRRQIQPVGALFIHNAQAAGGPLAKNIANGEIHG